MTEWFGMKAEIKEDGLCYFEDGRIIDPSQLIDDMGCVSPGTVIKVTDDPVIRKRVWISKEEAKKIWPDVKDEK